MGLERVFEASWTLRDLRSGPLGILLDGFCDWLLERGFARSTVRKHLGHVLHLNRWLAECGWQVSGGLSRKEVEGFLEAYPELCRNRGPLEDHLKRVSQSMSRLVEFLSYRGLFDPLPATPVYEPLLDGYLAWMAEYQHACDGTIELRRSSVRRFLLWLGEEATPKGLSGLCARHIESFFLDDADEMGHAARRSMQAALRTFLRFCLYEGYIRHGLDHAVPTLRTYKLARVPRGLSEPQAQAVLQSVDRDTQVGRRDYAILTMLHTYGVRGGQVRKLELSDIGWSQDQILFRATKGGKDSLLPLTPHVGEALLDYLQNARPSTSRSEVFMTCRAPYKPLQGLSEIVGRKIRMARVNAPCKGSNVFRHAFARRMVAEGHPFKAVADVLGHRHLSTTFIYTKVDFNALSQVPLEWPQEVGL
jgi:integrase/recombinase XerD